jgi:N utilization substance protein B
MQSLYEWDFHPKRKIEEIVSRNEKFFEKGKPDYDYIRSVAKGVVEKIKEIDKLVQKAAPQWPIEQIPGIDKTILRLATYELFYRDDIPPKVVINEAVELGKIYGSESTSKFVNGALGTLFKIKYADIEKEIKKKWNNLLTKIAKSQK